MIELFYQLFTAMCELLKKIEEGEVGAATEIELRNSKGPNIIFKMSTDVKKETKVKKKVAKKKKKVVKKKRKK